MKQFIPFFILLSGCIASSNESDIASLQSQLTDLESLRGTEEYLASPFVAAGDRAYIVGHQDGSFPDLGWHVKGEMGGVWAHPIKLMDGYSLNISDESGLDWCLTEAKEFINYPVGNVHKFLDQSLQVERFQFVPDGLEGAIVEYSIENKSESPQSLKLTFSGFSDLMPVWLSERLDWKDGKDRARWDEELKAWVIKDENNPWFLVFGVEGGKEADPLCHYERSGNGTEVGVMTGLKLDPLSVGVKRLVLAGSSKSLDSAKNTYLELQEDGNDFLENKLKKFEKLGSQVNLKVPDQAFCDVFRWTKYNTEWLMQEVPEIGRGVTAGIPDYPWWFGTDGAYIIQGLVSAGMHEEALSTIDVIMKLSREVNGDSGKIMHETSTNGVVFNPGNLNTTPTFIHALWKAFVWTGDKRILEYYEDIKAGIDWIESQDKDGNGYPDGAGMMEIHGLHSEMIDVVAYQYQAYLAASNFARVMDENDLAERYSNKADALRAKINDDWWVDGAASFADFRSTKEQAVELIEASIVRADTINKPWSVQELEQTLAKVRKEKNEGINGYVVHRNWVVNTPMEVGAADAIKAKIALKTAEKYTNRFGMFVTGIDRDEQQEKAEKWKAFSYVGAVMTLPTGVQAISEARYGNPDRSLDYLKRLENSFGYAFPGSMYEVSPDFGMISQGWNIYAVAVPVVDYFFGVQPLAQDERVIISPNPPSSWSKGALENIRVGNNEISVSFEKSPDGISYNISQKLDWEIVFQVDGRKEVFRDYEKEIQL